MLLFHVEHVPLHNSVWLNIECARGPMETLSDNIFFSNRSTAFMFDNHRRRRDGLHSPAMLISSMVLHFSILSTAQRQQLLLLFEMHSGIDDTAPNGPLFVRNDSGDFSSPLCATLAGPHSGIRMQLATKSTPSFDFESLRGDRFKEMCTNSAPISRRSPLCGRFRAHINQSLSNAGNSSKFQCD